MSEIRITKDGPYRVSGGLPLAKVTIGTNSTGESVRWEWGEQFPSPPHYQLCRCGGSAAKPFCDGTHVRIGFDGNETASREAYDEEAKRIEGPALSLGDVESLCAFARFCDPNGKVWNLVKETGNEAARANFVRETGDCPSGRLVAFDNATGQAIEPAAPPSIGAVEDPIESCAGPLWVRGGVRIVAADGAAYETRNRVTLCRCGASKNKPFCDGSHVTIKFQDGL